MPLNHCDAHRQINLNFAVVLTHAIDLDATIQIHIVKKQTSKHASNEIGFW